MKLFGSEFFELLRKYAEGIRGNLQDAGLSLAPAGSGAGYFGDDDDDDGDEYCGTAMKIKRRLQTEPAGDPTTFRQTQRRRKQKAGVLTP